MKHISEKVSTNGELFAVAIADLKKGPVSLKESVPIGRLASRLESCEYEMTPVRANVDVELELQGTGVLVQGQLDAEIEIQCGTCLAKAVIKISPDVNSFLFPRDEATSEGEGNELTPEDLEKEWFDGNSVVLDELLFDTLVLELPMNPKCGDSCPGLNPTANPDKTEDNIDPRLAPLASFKLEKVR